jgi:VWFA-related protein
MRDRRLILLIGLICLASGWMFLELGAERPVHAQQPAATAPSAATSPAATAPPPASQSNDTTVFHAETRLVLVDAVATDKKGNYIRDLTQKDFKVWEDGKEQAITSFSFEENTGSSSSQPRYMVLFFDNSTMDFGDQAKARDAAAKFIDANAGPGRLIALADFGGTVKISQNFTSDAQRLKQAVMGLKTSAVSPNADPVTVASMGTPPLPVPALGNAEADFGIHSVLLALRSLAKDLSTVPGRKTLVMLTSGFPLTPEYESEVTAVIDTCNKSNVAIYPIDVRGLTVPQLPGMQNRLMPPSIHSTSGSVVQAAFHYSENRPMLHLAAFAEPAGAFLVQHGGGGGGTGGGGGGGGHGGGGTGGGGTGGSGGGHGGTGGTGGGSGSVGTNGTGSTYNNGLYNQYNQPRQIIPPFPPSASDNQQVLYQLADSTGGFVILNTNDLLGGLDRIAKDQNQYYFLGYKPAVSAEGSCHTLKVKVERGGTQVRARSGYCNVKPADLLAGNPVVKDLEARAGGEMKGNVNAVMQAPFFYTSPNIAQVHLAVEIPSAALKFEKVKGKQRATLNILGIAYKPDATIAARFSDTVNVDFDEKKQIEDFQKQPFRYENQFDIASGDYKLKVAFSSGNDTFGKLETPLVIDPYRGQDFSISGVALSNDIRRAADNSTGLDSQLLQDRTPLLFQGVQVSPSASNHFKKTDVAAVYAEVYEPLLKKPNPPEVAYELIVVERKSGQEKYHIGERTPPGKAGDPVIALGLRLPVSTLGPGSYQMKLRAVDSVGNSSKTRTADFDVE